VANLRLSIIVPTLNEAEALVPFLAGLRSLRVRGHEVIVVDGGSQDGTVGRAGDGADRALQVAPGRATQMNAGASAASGEVLLFVHADTRLPDDADRLITEGLAGGDKVWGRFDVRLSGTRWMFPVIGTLMNLRSRITGIATGDQGMFVRREAFESVGGFPEIPLMEDIALSRRLKHLGRPLCLHGPVITSSRRWQTHGVIRTVLLMWALRLAYAVGVSPAYLARTYYPVSGQKPSPLSPGVGEKHSPLSPGGGEG